MCRMYENYQNASTFGKVIRIIGVVILGAVGITAFAMLFGYVVMLLWNWLMPMLFNLPTITFWPAVGVIILARLIFGGFKHGPDRYRPPRPPKFAENWKSHFKSHHVNGFQCGDWKHYDKFWKEEGSEAFKNYIKRNEDKKEE